MFPISEILHNISEKSVSDDLRQSSALILKHQNVQEQLLNISTFEDETISLSQNVWKQVASDTVPCPRTEPPIIYFLSANQNSSKE
jgi:hypothetical protein